jgi:hypothetical protein
MRRIVEPEGRNVKTSKNQRDLTKRTLLGEPTGHWIETDFLVSALDDIDTLTEKLKAREAMLERCKPWLYGHEEFEEFTKLVADLAALSEGD